MLKPDEFCIRRNATIGFADAEEDLRFLHDCFVDTGDLALLRDTEEPRRILLGRTGTGKTALLKMLDAKEDHVVWVNPHDLALNYIANNQVLRFFEQNGVNLDLFYRLLWRHVFAVELIKARYGFTSAGEARETFFEKLRSLFAGEKGKQAAVDYLREWGGTIWEDTEYRVKEVTQSLEQKLSAHLGARMYPARAEAGADFRLKQEERAEIIRRGQDVVNAIQIKRLSQIIDMLADTLLDDPQKRFFILVDRLDEDWVEDRIRYHLIRALIETSRDFQRVRTAKIIIALRQDLIDRVFRLTRDAGFQQEKYDSLCLRVTWRKASLLQVLDSRVNVLVRRQYTKRPLTHRDLLPNPPRGDISDYVIARTLYRPRDVIEFFNCCREHGEGKAKLNRQLLSAAEAEFSRRRFRSMGDEWYAEFPGLLDFAVALLRERPLGFRLADIPDQEAESLCLSLATDHYSETGALVSMVKQVVDQGKPARMVMHDIFRVFYRCGLVGLKSHSYEGTAWAFKDQPTTVTVDLDDNTRVQVCPAFYRVLGIRLAPRLRS